MDLRVTNKQVETFQKEILYRVITEGYKSEYIKRQRRINSLKSPFIKVKGILQSILGENIEEMHEEEVIDLEGLFEENKRTRIMLNELNYKNCILYFDDTVKFGLNRANKIWRKKIQDGQISDS